MHQRGQRSHGVGLGQGRSSRCTTNSCGSGNSTTGGGTIATVVCVGIALVSVSVAVIIAIFAVVTTGVWIGMDSRVSGQLIGSRELLGTAWKGTGMGFLSGMGTNMASLVLQTVERLVADRALVRPRELSFLWGSTVSVHYV